MKTQQEKHLDTYWLTWIQKLRTVYNLVQKFYRAWIVGVLHTFRQSRYYSDIKWTRKNSLYWSEWYFYKILSWGNFSALPMTILYWYCVNVFTTSSEDMWKFRLIVWSNMKTWSRLSFVITFQLKRKEPFIHKNKFWFSSVLYSFLLQVFESIIKEKKMTTAEEFILIPKNRPNPGLIESWH